MMPEENTMTTSVETHTPEVLAQVFEGAKHIDAIEVLQEDINFLENLSKTFGKKPTKEETAVLTKYQTVLDSKVEYLGQVLKNAGMNFSREKSTFAQHFHLMKDYYNITIVVSEKQKS
jgi:vacuolar-type H+-ATPase subunit C/Vma6